VLLYDRMRLRRCSIRCSAGELFDMRIYFVIYPDLFGGQPQLNLESCATAMWSASESPVHDGSATPPGWRSIDVSTMGEQKHEFLTWRL